MVENEVPATVCRGNTFVLMTDTNRGGSGDVSGLYHPHRRDLSEGVQEGPIGLTGPKTWIRDRGS